jgi:NADH-quinone oxidoreductase subunit J
LRQGFLRYLPVGGLVGLVLVVELLLVELHWTVEPGAVAKAAAPIPPPDQISNSHALGHILYTQYFYLFQASGLILLIAMIGAIVLSLRSRAHVRRQSIADQVGRRTEDAVAVRQVPTGGGV